MNINEELFEASKKDDANKVKELLDSGANIECVDVCGNTHL